MNRVQSVDPDGHSLYRYYDLDGQLVKVREFTGTVASGLYAYADTEYTYDWQGNLTQVENREPHQSGGGDLLSTTVITYDVLGRKTGMDDADMGIWDYEYDAIGNLVRQKDANGDAICTWYDSLGRPIRKEIDPTSGDACPEDPNPFEGGSNHLASYGYDTETNGIGKISAASWGANASSNGDTFYYDTEGRLYEQTRSLDGRTYTLSTVEFDPFDRPLQMEYPDGEVITYSYDKEGAEALTATVDLLVETATFNTQGQRASIERGSGVDSVFTYYAMSGNQGTGNNNGRLQNLWHGSTSVDYAEQTYQYDPAGNILQIDSAWYLDTISDTQDYAYDELNRLISAEGDSNSAITDYEREYAYNEIGNIMSFAGDAFAYNDTAHTHTLTHIEGYERFIYDANGNMTWRSDSGSADVYTQTFDVQNRLTEIEHSNGAVTEFEYTDGEQRVKTMVEDPWDKRTTTYFPFPNYE